LNVLRPSEVIGARSEEIDLQERTWRIPGYRMKAGMDHEVPLCDRSIELIQLLRPAHSIYLFPGSDGTRPMWPDNLRKLAKELRPNIEITAHGFRSCFKDWAHETTNAPHEVIEKCLAHAIGDKVERAYRRGELLNKRRKLMVSWAKFCNALPTIDQRVIPIRAPA
jgi:integrase